MSVDCAKISANNFMMTSFHIYLMSGCLGVYVHVYVPYPRKRGPMGSAPYIGHWANIEGWADIQVAGKLSTLSS